MPKYQVSLNLADLPIRRVHVDADGTAMKPGFTKVNTFDHGVDLDTLPRASISHVIYHHVQDALYFVKDGLTPIEVGFFPDNITDMASVMISFDEILSPIAITSISPTNASVTVKVGASVQNTISYQPAGVNTSKTLTVVSSAPAKATVAFDGPVGGAGATGVTVTGVEVGTSIITCTTTNGKATTFNVIVEAE